MEYYWGYATATQAPLSNPFVGKPHPTRSNSSSTPKPAAVDGSNNTNTNTTTPSSRKPRFAGHTRAQSTDSGTSSAGRAGGLLGGSSSSYGSSPLDLLHLHHRHHHHRPHKREQTPDHHNHHHHHHHRAGGGGDDDTDDRPQNDPADPTPKPKPSPYRPLATDFSSRVSVDGSNTNSTGAWWEIGSAGSAAAEAAAALAPPARPKSASASAPAPTSASALAPEPTPERTSLLRKPPPVPSLQGSNHHRSKHKKLPPVPRPDDDRPGQSDAQQHDTSLTATVSSSSHGHSSHGSVLSQTTTNTTVSSIAPSVAALAAASGAALPITPSSPIKASFAQRLSQHVLLSSSHYHHYSHHYQQHHHPPPLPQQQPQHHHHQQRHATMSPDPPALQHKIGTSGVPISRAESASSASGTPSLSVRTMTSTDAGSSSAESRHRSSGAAASSRPFVVRNGRTYIADPTVVYPLPVDLPELHRQSMKTLLLFQLFGRPVCSPSLAKKPPKRVLDLGCGSGFWSMMCHRWYSQRGHPNISFTGLDVVPVPGASAWGAGGGSGGDGSSSSTGGSGPGSGPQSSSNGPSDPMRPDRDMKWRFVQHNICHAPWPFQDGEFDLVMMQGLSLGNPVTNHGLMMDEVVRVLQPGGTIEVWESDHTIRMLRPHVPEAGGGAHAPSDDEGGSGIPSSSSSDDFNEEAAELGAYVMTGRTPMSSPLNNFLVEYNSWLSKALDARHLSPVPCTNIEPLLVQEESLTSVGSRRLAVPFSEVKWEREGVGGVVTKDGKSYIETRGTKGLLLRSATGGDGDDIGGGGGGGVASGGGGGGGGAKQGKVLSAGQQALRRTALMTVVQMIQSLEAVLREASGKSQDEWDGWQGKMMNDLLRENGTSWGECLEVGAWWARKKPLPSSK